MAAWPLRRRWVTLVGLYVDAQCMTHRRMVLGSLSLSFALLALFPLTGANATPPADHDEDGFRARPMAAVALVGDQASGQHHAVGVIPELRHDGTSGRTSFAFTDEDGKPVAPPAAES